MMEITGGNWQQLTANSVEAIIHSHVRFKDVSRHIRVQYIRKGCKMLLDASLTMLVATLGLEAIISQNYLLCDYEISKSLLNL